jgi:hypothetical protein
VKEKKDEQENESWSQIIDELHGSESIEIKIDIKWLVYFINWEEQLRYPDVSLKKVHINEVQKGRLD